MKDLDDFCVAINSQIGTNYVQAFADYKDLPNNLYQLHVYIVCYPIKGKSNDSNYVISEFKQVSSEIDFDYCVKRVMFSLMERGVLSILNPRTAELTEVLKEVRLMLDDDRPISHKIDDTLNK